MAYPIMINQRHIAEKRAICLFLFFKNNKKYIAIKVYYGYNTL